MLYYDTSLCLKNHRDDVQLDSTARFRYFGEHRIIYATEGQEVDGVNGVDFTLPREDLGRMNTDLQDTVNHDTYVCLHVRA